MPAGGVELPPPARARPAGDRVACSSKRRTPAERKGYTPHSADPEADGQEAAEVDLVPCLDGMDVDGLAVPVGLVRRLQVLEDKAVLPPEDPGVAGRDQRQIET